MAQQKGGIKLRRSKYRKTKYAVQYVRTRRNKIRRLMKRIPFDPTAGPAIKQIEARAARPIASA